MTPNPNAWFKGRYFDVNEAVHPETFGAVGDGTADDTVAVRDAILSGLSTGKPVLIGSHYKVTDTVIEFGVPDTPHIIALPGRGKIRSTQTGAATTIDLSACERAVIEGVEFENLEGGFSGKLIKLERTDNEYPTLDFTFRGCKFKAPGGIGVSLDQMYGSVLFEDFEFDSCDIGCYSPNQDASARFVHGKFRNPGSWMVQDIYEPEFSYVQFIGRQGDPGYAYTYGFVWSFGAQARFAHCRFKRVIPPVYSTNEDSVWVFSPGGGLAFDTCTFDAIALDTDPAIRNTLVKIGNTSAMMDQPVTFINCRSGPGLLEVVGNQKLTELVLIGNPFVYDDQIRDPSNLVVRVLRLMTKSGSTGITPRNTVQQLPSVRLQPRPAVEAWENNTETAGNLFMADRTNWDPLNRGSGGPYVVGWDGSDWVAGGAVVPMPGAMPSSLFVNAFQHDPGTKRAALWSDDVGNFGNEDHAFQLELASGWGASLWTRTENNSGDIIWQVGHYTAASPSTAFVWDFRIRGDGMVIVGGTGAIAGSERLQVRDGIRTDGAIVAASATINGQAVTFGANDSAGSGFRVLRVPNA